MRKLSFILYIIILMTIIGNFSCTTIIFPTRDLIAYYPFEGNASDLSGNGNNGIEHGHLHYTKGKIGKAARFDGVNDFIEIIPQRGNLLIGDFTVSAWVYLENWKSHPDADVDRQYIFDGHSHSITNTSDFYRQGFCLIYDGNISTEELHNAIWYYSGEYLEQNTSLKLKKQWRFIVLERKGDQDYTYIDGELITSTYKSDFRSDDLLDMKHRWFIGTFSGNNPYYTTKRINYSFHGKIDELRIYSRALSASEVEELYYSGCKK